MSWIDEAEAVREQVDELAMKHAGLDEWRLIDARLVHALVEAQQHATELQGEMVALVKTSKPCWQWFQTHQAMREVHEVMDDLRVLQMCVRSRIFELEAGEAQAAL
jgi:hypothetical protein